MAGEEARGTRVAFFGGSFDPPHLGHLAVARAARDALALDTVLFAPVGAQPLKPLGSTAAFADRLAMTELAIAGERGFAISLVDAPETSGKPNYTLDSLRTLRAELAADSTLFCLMGADSFIGLRGWRGAAEIPFVASLIVASRPGQSLDNLAASLPQGVQFESCDQLLPPPAMSTRVTAPEASVMPCRLRNIEGEAALFYVLPNLDVEISASAIREQIRENASRDSAVSERAEGQLLPSSVARYIRQHGLYR